MMRKFWRLFTRIALVLAGAPLFIACAKYGMVPPKISKVEFSPPGPIQPGDDLTVTAHIVNHAKEVVTEAEIGNPVELRIVLNDSGQYPDATPKDNYWTGSAKWSGGTSAGRGMPVSVICRATFVGNTYRAARRAKGLLLVDTERRTGEK